MKWIALICGTIAACYLAYAAANPTYSYRYRITLDVETPSGKKSGSSVLEVRSSSSSWGLPEMRGVRYAIKGDAVFVDLLGGRNIVGLLAGGEFGEDEGLMHKIPCPSSGAFRQS